MSFARPLLLLALGLLPVWWWLRAKRLGRLSGTRMSDVRPAAGATERLWVARLPVSQLAKWKTTVQMVAIAFLLVGDAASPLVTTLGIWLIWIAAGLTLITGYDYLRTGLRHMAEDAPPGSAE